MIFRAEQGAGELNGFLDSGSRIEGELRFETSFRVDGKVTGRVVSDGNLVVGEGGEIEGEIHVGQVFVCGTVRGKVRALRRTHLAPSGKVFADIETPSLLIEDGALFEGQCSMSSQGAEAKPEAGAGSVAKLVPTVPVAKGRLGP